MTPQIARAHPQRRTSSDAVWPLRTADGRTFAQRSADKQKEAKQ